MPTLQALSARHIGQGVPVLIIHGWTMCGQVEAYDFEPFFTKTNGYKRIYVDLPGMGNSPIGDAKDLDSMLESVAQVVENDILPSKFLLIGTSCGAYLARALAFKFSDAVDGLLLRVPVVEPESSKRDVDPFVPVIADPALLSSLSATDRENLGDIPVQTPEYIDALRRKAEATWIPAIAAADSAALDPIREDPERYRLKAPFHSPATPFSKPTLILTGRQDTDVGFRDAWGLMANFPRATFAVLDGASHGLPVGEGEVEVFRALVKAWLGRVEEVRRVGERR